MNFEIEFIHILLVCCLIYGLVRYFDDGLGPRGF